MSKSSIQPLIDYAHQQNRNYLEGFYELLRFPSISQDPAHKSDMEACADWLVSEMQRIGLDNCRRIPTDGHAIVYGDWLHAGADKPTVLIYAHYDVQPVGSEAAWKSPPFEPTLIDGRLVARGTVDDKCGIWVNLKAIETILAVNGELPINIKLFFEGEEELGSPNVQSFVAENKDLLQADMLILCDGPFSPEQPMLGYSVRGTVMGEVRLRGSAHDLHSGRYGGVVQNPIHYLATIIDSFHDEDGRVRIPNFYDDMLPLSEHQRTMLEEVWQVIGAKIEDGAGVAALWGQAMGSFAERSTSLPTLDINGIHGGYWGEGTKAIIPSTAGFKVTIRLVPNQSPEKMWEAFTAHVLSFANERFMVDMNLLSTAYPFTMSSEGKGIEAIQAAFSAVLGKEALLLRHGGSLPIGGVLQHELNIPTMMLGFGSGDNSHAPNEYIVLRDIQTGIDIAIHFFMVLSSTQNVL